MGIFTRMVSKRSRRRTRRQKLIGELEVALQEAIIAHDKQEQMLDGLDDGWDEIRQAVGEVSAERGEWAGYPCPVHGAAIVLEPRHPLYGSLNGVDLDDEPSEGEKKPADMLCEELVAVWDAIIEEVGWREVNWWIDRRGWHIKVMQNKDGRGRAVVIPRNSEVSRWDMAINTLGASQAWSVKAEFKALERLKTLIPPHAFRYYLLTGMFMETSKRSKVIYVFRKGRPTVVMAPVLNHEHLRILCALCLHPVGYYDTTFAGAMVPTDDVIAHITMMRGDERKFWGKCNQHEASSDVSGI